MHNTRMRLFVLMDTMACRDELDWLINAIITQPTIIQKSTVHRSLCQSLQLSVQN